MANAGEAGCRGKILARPALNAALRGHSLRFDRNPHTPRDRGRDWATRKGSWGRTLRADRGKPGESPGHGMG
ncbi:hypothetical protein TthSNM33_25550 (plasmid) [Thermus thermophilus]|nr:hypothetical protein TthSNM33_25550 [Thermus thermophilus]